jgi:hypothetical protein
LGHQADNPNGFYWFMAVVSIFDRQSEKLVLTNLCVKSMCSRSENFQFPKIIKKKLNKFWPIKATL